MKKTLLLLLLFFVACSSPDSDIVHQQVTVGAEVLLEEQLPLLEGKNVGLITNHTAILPDGRHIADVFHGNPNISLTALFGPEHGIRGEADRAVDHGTDPATGLPVYSLYGDTRKPTPEMLAEIDVLIFDIQDVGARFYTYISTMNNAMEAAAEQGKEFIVLDRPNPITGRYFDGNILDTDFRSFVGIQPIPVAHGMTVGELAYMFNEEGLLENGVRAELTVVQMKNYRRNMWFDETGLPWIKPSPNMLTLQTAIVYPATCFLEGTNISEARGTGNPFEWFGAPWIDGELLAEELNGHELPGVRFEPIEYVPGRIVDGIEIYPPKFVDETCYGVTMQIIDRNAFESVKTGVYILATLSRLYPDRYEWRNERMDRLWGTDTVRKALMEGELPSAIIQKWENDLNAFSAVREKYLLYQ
jgi:uncharacterized protein YbbC (DUF1343 family)